MVDIVDFEHALNDLVVRFTAAGVPLVDLRNSLRRQIVAVSVTHLIERAYLEAAAETEDETP